MMDCFSHGWIPRDFWLQPWEKQSIIRYYLDHPLEGYRRLTFMMLDADVVAVSPSSVWRVLQQAGLLSRWKGKPSRKGTGFEQPPPSASGPIHGEGRKGPSDKRGGSYGVLRQEESGFATTSAASRRIWTAVPVRIALQADRCS